jgi:acyl-CoA reductase-like NAD-dependent aldehyde dehydrogenase
MSETKTTRLRGADAAAPRTAGGPARLGEHGILLAGAERRTGSTFDVRSPYDGSTVAVVHRAGPAEIEEAIAGAAAAFSTTRRLASWQRAETLERVSATITARRDELARTIALEAGKPLRTARVEVDRSAFTFKVAAEEAKRIGGEILPLDWMPGMEGREGHVRRLPIGPIAGITPFNFPLNLVAHKVAPALAAGNPIVIRPASQTPLSALALGRIAVEAGWPAEGYSVVPSTTRDASPLVEDERIALLSFTGSPAVGWDLKRRAGRKRVTLELGGNAAVIVHRDADLDYAAERITLGAFAYAGQSCISAQRLFVHEEVYDRFAADLVARAGRLVVGDPLEEETDLGPVIDTASAERIEEWVEEAVAAGARLLAGGRRQGTLWPATIVASAPPGVRVNCEEVFAPVVTLQPYRDVDEAIAAAGASDYGLQAGIFTHDERVIAAAVERLEVGGLMVNDVSSFRVDHMPYGGVKLSGFGREGVRYAIEEMTELKLVTYNRRPRP